MAKNWFSYAFLAYGEENAEREILCIQDFTPGEIGFWKLPGGVKYSGDHDSVVTVRRRVLQQTGISIEGVNLSRVRNQIHIGHRREDPAYLRFYKGVLPFDKVMERRDPPRRVTTAFFPLSFLRKSEDFLPFHKDVLLEAGLLGSED
ncbi:MAG TPA: hypothetical protein PK609_01045 [Candidatus Paceibacterota bacterium]|nr:hypothetical protein [Candidatus Paceibacterota bacterium]